VGPLWICLTPLPTTVQLVPCLHVCVWGGGVQVVRYGAKASGSQRVLKELSEGFTAFTGQCIFASLSFDESSHPVAGVEAAAASVWGGPLTPEDARSTFRFVLLLTDGMSRDNQSELRALATG
jgi:hypothetical protein